MVVFCAKCVRQLCPVCLVEQPSCKLGAAAYEAHAFTKLDDAPGWLRAQLDSMQAQLRREQNSLLDDASRLARDMQGCDEQLHANVARVVHSMQEAIETLEQLQSAIRAAAASAIASLLRPAAPAPADLESVTITQRVEDLNARAIACRQLSRAVRSLLNLDDSSLLTKIPFLRNLVRCTQPVAASTPSLPAPSDSQPAPVPAPAVHPLPATQESAIESQLMNIIQQGKQLILALDSISHVLFIISFQLFLIDSSSSDFELMANLDFKLIIIGNSV